MKLRIVHAATAAVVVVGCLCAQDVRVTNMAGIARSQWVDIAVPIVDASALPDLCWLQPQGFPLVKGGNVGLHSTMFHAFVELGPDETLVAEIVPAPAQSAQAPAFSMTDWVADELLRVIPRPVVLAGGVEHRVGDYAIDIVEQNAARTVVHLRARVRGTPLVCDQWLYAYTAQDVLQFETTLTNSDPAIPDLTYNVDGVWFESGEYLVLDHAQRQTFQSALPQWTYAWHPSYTGWVSLVSGPRVIGRGEQFLVSGSVLCQADRANAGSSTVYAVGPFASVQTSLERQQTLAAASQAPVVGVHLGWDGRWLAYGITPEVPAGSTNGGWDDAARSAQNFWSSRLVQRDVYAQRPRGLQLRAGSTGSQEDFGASKGSYAVTAGDPRFIHELGYSVYELFARPFHNREADGSPVLARNHPGLRTWSQLIHCVTTQDTLGMVCPLPVSWASNGYSAYDDQHRSHNNGAAWLALTGSHAMRAVFEDLLEMDLAQVPNRVDSPRGEGRLHQAWANMLLLLDDPADRFRLFEHMRTRIQTLDSLWPGRQFVGDASRPIRVLGVGSDPTFLDPQGIRVPAIIVWEHSIAVMGFYAAWRITGDPLYHQFASEISRLVVERCFFEENGNWIACTAVRYRLGVDEGLPLPPSSYYLGSPDIHVGINFYDWIAPAVLICRDLHRHLDGPLVARCEQILANHGAPQTWAQAEWWAVMPR